MSKWMKWFLAFFYFYFFVLKLANLFFDIFRKLWVESTLLVLWCENCLLFLSFPSPFKDPHHLLHGSRKEMKENKEICWFYSIFYWLCSRCALQLKSCTFSFVFFWTIYFSLIIIISQQFGSMLNVEWETPTIFLGCESINSIHLNRISFKWNSST